MKPLRWWVAMMAWDGLLPLAVAGVTVLIHLYLNNGANAELWAMVPPLFAAVLRCIMGEKQIRQRCRGELPFLRQLAMAVAILLMVAFEAVIAIIVLAEDKATWRTWQTAGWLYLLYIGMCLVAFMPPRDLRRVRRRAEYLMRRF